MRDRSNLTSIQVTHEQKKIIDEAHEMFTSLDFKKFGYLSRGEFLAQLCQPHLIKEVVKPPKPRKPSKAQLQAQENMKAFKELE